MNAHTITNATTTPSPSSQSAGGSPPRPPALVKHPALDAEFWQGRRIETLALAARNAADCASLIRREGCRASSMFAGLELAGAERSLEAALDDIRMYRRMTEGS